MSGATPPGEVATALTLLFVPGDRPDRYARAAASGADVIIVDLEDAVAPEAKGAAREAAARWFADGGPGIVRVNAAGTTPFEEDIAALAPHVDVVVLPKAQDPQVVADVVDRLRTVRPGAGVVALVETARGLLRVAETAAVPGVLRVAFGNVDLSCELGLDPEDRQALGPMRASIVVASAAAGLPAPIDGVSGSIDDVAVVEAGARHAGRVGYGAKLCIHPRQVPVVAGALGPTGTEVEWAARVVQAWEACDAGVVVHDGMMIDRPVIDRARRVLAVAQRSTRSSRPDAHHDARLAHQAEQAGPSHRREQS